MLCNIKALVSFLLSTPDACHSDSSIFPEASWFCQISRLFPVHFSQGKLVEQVEVMQKFVAISKKILGRCCVYMYDH